MLSTPPFRLRQNAATSGAPGKRPDMPMIAMLCISVRSPQAGPRIRDPCHSKSVARPDCNAQGARGPDLRDRAVGGVLWSAFGTALRVGMTLAAQIALARILGPEPFGLFAVALVVIALSSLFAEVGLAYGLIQKPEVGPRDIRFAFTWQVLLGLGVMGVVLAGAGLVAAAMDEPRAAGVLRALAPGILLGALAATPTMLLRRRMDFKWLQLAGATAYAVGYLGVGLPLA